MFYFIINPHSRAGKGYQVWVKVEKQLKAKDIEYRSYLTEGPGHAREIAAKVTDPTSELGKTERTIIILGGDGTLNEVLDGLSFCVPITIGYIPSGSGCDFSRSMKLPKRANAALNRILNPKYETYIDYGVLSYGTGAPVHRRFLVSCGIGYDAAVCMEPLLKRSNSMFNRFRLGKLGYIAAGIKRLVLLQPADGYVILDCVKKVSFKKMAFISAHIQRFEGGGFAFSPNADASDGILDLCVISGIGKLRLIPVLLRAMFGKHTKMKGVHIYRCQEASIHINKPLIVHTDGEDNGVHEDISMVCMKRRLHIIV